MAGLAGRFIPVPGLPGEVEPLAEQGKRVAKQARAEFAKSQKVRKDTETDTDRALAILAAIEWDYPAVYKALQPYLEIAAEQGAQQGAYQVAVVNDQNMVSIERVKIAEQVGTMWVISEGLKPGQRVVAEGVQNARPGMKVNPTLFVEGK